MRYLLLFLLLFKTPCACADLLKVWKLDEIVLETTNQSLVGASIKQKNFGIAVYSASDKSVNIEVDDDLIKIVIDRVKLNGDNPLLGESYYYAIKLESGLILYVEIDKRNNGLFRVAAMDIQVWPIATVSENKVTLNSPKFCSLITEAMDH